jgi:hypothetical protein
MAGFHVIRVEVYQALLRGAGFAGTAFFLPDDLRLS